MKPLKSTLQGCAGIFAAFGRDSLVLDLQTIPQDAALVALVGPKGAGKSTILDSLHPYRVMPSRSTTLGPGGFSYWTHINGATAMKELVWENDGVCYHTLLSFKSNGKTQKSDCYLYQRDAGDDWKPVLGIRWSRCPICKPSSSTRRIPVASKSTTISQFRCRTKPAPVGYQVILDESF